MGTLRCSRRHFHPGDRQSLGIEVAGIEEHVRAESVALVHRRFQQPSDVRGMQGYWAPPVESDGAPEGSAVGRRLFQRPDGGDVLGQLLSTWLAGSGEAAGLGLHLGEGDLASDDVGVAAQHLGGGCDGGGPWRGGRGRGGRRRGSPPRPPAPRRSRRRRRVRSAASARSPSRCRRRGRRPRRGGPRTARSPHDRHRALRRRRCRLGSRRQRSAGSRSRSGDSSRPETASKVTCDLASRAMVVSVGVSSSTNSVSASSNVSR